MNSEYFRDTPLGTLRIAERDGAIETAAFVSGAEASAPDSPVLREADAWLDRYFEGRDPGPVPPLAPKGTAFQKAVWNALLSVPYGKTIAYGALAERMGLSPACARAIGGALHRNPILLFIPCHRVMGKDGSLTGFAAGLARKRYLSELERH